MADWVTTWLESVKPKVRVTTFSGYSDNSRLHILSDRISSMKIEDIYKADVQEFYKRLVDKGLSGGTIAIIHNIICMIFTYAVDLNVIEKNYASGAMKNYISKKATKNIIALTIEEQNRLIEFIAQSPKYKRWEPMIIFMLGTGCRIGETVGLTWDDINFNKKIITVSRNLNYKKKDGRCQFFFSRESEINQKLHKKKDNTITKSEAGQGRKIPLLYKIVEQLDTQKKIQEAEGVDKIDYVLEGFRNFVFTTKNALPQKPSTLNRTLDSIVEEYNKEEKINAVMENREEILLPHMSAHTLRHTFCTRLCESTSDLKFVMSVMGHANKEITLGIYYHIHEKNLTDNFEKFSENASIL